MSQIIVNEGAAAATPATGKVTLYAKADGKLYSKDDAGIETPMGGTGTVTHTSGALTASAIIVGNGTDDVKPLASLGTTTTVLHGNAAGQPSFGAVSLTTDVSGTLPIANGGTNITTYTTGDVLYASAANTLSKLTAGTNGHVLTLAAGVPSWAAASGGGITSGTAIATTSGTSHDFTSIPSTVKKISLMLSGVSTSGTSNVQVQIGDSGGIETSGYSGEILTANTADLASFTSGFLTQAVGNAGHSRYGIVELALLDATTNLWCCSIVIGNTSGSGNIGGGSKALSATLDRIRLTTVNGTDTFDAGTINILYE